MGSWDIAGKTVIVTGANSGIGKATAEKLAGMGARVVMVCRNQEKGVAAKREIEHRTGKADIELLLADFASLASVRDLARQFLLNHESLDALVNNAGLARIRRSLTVDGFETTFQVNYLSHFLLTNLLLERLKKSAPSRIVNVSSVAHYDGQIDFGNLQLESGYFVMRAYSNSKLALVLFTYELSRRLEGTGVTANCLHPGAVATGIWRKPLGPAAFLGRITSLFMVGPEKGAETQVFLASAPEVQGVTGKYFDSKREKRSSESSYDGALAERLWNVSASLVGLS